MGKVVCGTVEIEEERRSNISGYRHESEPNPVGWAEEEWVADEFHREFHFWTEFQLEVPDE